MTGLVLQVLALALALQAEEPCPPSAPTPTPTPTPAPASAPARQRYVVEGRAADGGEESARHAGVASYNATAAWDDGVGVCGWVSDSCAWEMLTCLVDCARQVCSMCMSGIYMSGIYMSGVYMMHEWYLHDGSSVTSCLT